MNFTRMLGLAVLAALAITAWAGASSASAWEFCQKKGEIPCESRYKAGQVFSGTLEAKTTAKFTGASEAICESAGIEFTKLSEFGSPVGEVTVATFGGCSKTVTAANLTWEIRFVDVSGGKGVWEATLSSLGGGQPGVTIGGSCTYTAAEMHLELQDTLVTGGAPKLVGKVPLTGGCGSETLTVAYRLAQTIYPG